MWTRPIVVGAALSAVAGCGLAAVDGDVPRGMRSPAEASERSSDVAITAAIHRQILGTGQLAAQADRVHVRTEGGRVTLRGFVETEADRDEIVSIVERTDAVARIDDQLEILDGEP